MKSFAIFVPLIFHAHDKILKTNKKKIINDPVFGFITIQSDLIFDLIEHPYFQRLRRIKQLGLSCIVFPGANHTRFEHALGALYLMRSALHDLRIKGVKITDEEVEAASVAILLHDIGHGPFSHALEYSIVEGLVHEKISLMLMEDLNRQFDGRLSMAIRIFKGEYPKKFLHQLVASQLDVDRLDYLRRDSFFTGVTEGVIGSDRIIKMLNVRHDELVVEAKAIYSIEKFLIARRLMYWQVYLHKTVLSAEFLLVNVLKRAKELAIRGDKLFATPNLSLFLESRITLEQLQHDTTGSGCSLLSVFAGLEDDDVIASIKQWQYHSDRILSYLATSLINRKLFRIKVQDRPIPEKKLARIRESIVEHFQVEPADMGYFMVHDSITNSAYLADASRINILQKNGKICDINEASDINLSGLSLTVRKYFVCYPKELDVR